MSLTSIAMATYNGERFLPEQLASLAAQTLLPAELHVGDDGSTDGTLAILAHFARTAPFPVHVHRNPENLGYGENFIRTALRCASRWIAFCDQDDVWLPEKLARCASAVASGPADLRLIAHNALVVGEDLAARHPLYDYPRQSTMPRLTLDPEWFCLGFTQVFDRKLIEAIPPSPRIDIGWHRERQSHDVWISLLANATGSISLIGDPLALYRSHGGNVTLTDSRAGLGARIAATLRNNGGLYEARGEYLRAASRILRDKAEAADDEVLRAGLPDAAARLEAQGDRLGQRARVYQAPGLGQRVAAYRSLRGAGAYGGQWGFGRSARLKDLAYALLAPVVPKSPVISSR